MLRGCDPKRVLVGAGELVDWSRRMHARGAITEPPRIDWPSLMAFKRTFTDPVPAQRERTFKEAGIEALHGHVEFVDRLRLRVDDEEIGASHVVIAAGATPAPLKIPGEEHLATSTDFLELDAMPRSVLFVGGGYISFEFAHLAARAGARARIVHRGERPLEGFDAELVERLCELTRDEGISLELDASVVRIEKRERGYTVRAKRGDSDIAFDAELVVHGGGRIPDIDGLALERGGIARTKRGVQVNRYLQSETEPAVYAAGDAADGGGLPLTPVAGYEGEIVAENILHGNRRTADFAGLVSVVYSVPALASVGLDEERAKQRGLVYKCLRGDASEWYTYRRINAKAAYKVLVDERSDEILGAQLLGPYAEELANLFALAMRAKIGMRLLKETLFGYPSPASDLEYMLQGP